MGLLCATFAFSCGQQRSRLVMEEITLEYETKDNTLDIFSQIFYVKGTSDPYSGSGKMPANDGAYNRWTFDNGRLVKVETVNSQNVRIRENVYKEGYQIKSSSWYETGEKWIEWDKLELLTKEWHKNGNLKSEVPWNDLGAIDGVVKIWDEDGELLSQERYKNGLKVGL